jgi:hypothetical protein
LEAIGCWIASSKRTFTASSKNIKTTTTRTNDGNFEFRYQILGSIHTADNDVYDGENGEDIKRLNVLSGEYGARPCRLACHALVPETWIFNGRFKGVRAMECIILSFRFAYIFVPVLVCDVCTV